MMSTLRRWIANTTRTNGHHFWEHCARYDERLKMAERFHRAARDGYLDLLREATRKDCDRPDEDGMTPTIWAAYFGNLDALRLILARGGDPDKCDYLGNTALHAAAINGHINSVTFLVNFGVNIWALDNDFHTALDVAAINEHMQIVHYLDAVIAKQSALNKKIVRKLKERSILEAQKRVKEFQRRQAKSQKKAQIEDKKMSEIRSTMETVSLNPANYAASQCPNFWKRGHSIQTEHIRPYSDHFNTSKHRAGHYAPTTAIMRKIQHHKKRIENGSLVDDFRVSEVQDGKKSVRSLAGLRRDAQVLYVGDVNNTQRSVDKRSSSSEPDFKYTNGNGNGNDSGVVSYDSGPVQQESASLFDRPGLGTISFLRAPLLTPISMMTLPTQDDADEETTKYLTSETKMNHRNSCADSIGTLGSLAKRAKELPWDEEEVADLDDERLFKCSPLELFLASCGLTDFISILNKDKIDLDALLLCNDEDLKGIGLPLGPRRKLLDAAKKRKDVLTTPGVVFDTRL